MLITWRQLHERVWELLLVAAKSFAVGTFAILRIAAIVLRFGVERACDGVVLAADYLEAWKPVRPEIFGA